MVAHKDFWDKRYAEEGFVYGETPNEFFRREIEKLQPGSILLPGEGEGRNAIFAASLGWDVVAFDQSAEGQKKALTKARQKALKIDYQVTDIENFNAPLNSFDCIALIFVHFHARDRQRIHQKLITYLKPGGVLIIEVFSAKQLGRKSGGPQNPEMLYFKEDLVGDFEQLSNLKLIAKETQLNEGLYHKGKAAVLRLTGTKLF
jgi:SAM-dependent methyltransferase